MLASLAPEQVAHIENRYYRQTLKDVANRRAVNKRMEGEKPVALNHVWRDGKAVSKYRPPQRSKGSDGPRHIRDTRRKALGEAHLWDDGDAARP